ncbi:oxygen-insensitive NAD(P)H-dependent nitroreductase NfsB [Erwinia sp. S63]|jgi:nitroreductase / dihydropteridine reductase|uniref:oxygen-insensitive NAD(P)H-dependent nitroreductase NfsB n=1 Tax=Erwiniaceae TaxID=1903409 RepID=UPI0005F7CC65|nr:MULTISPECIES: oxygen-insensitive NAD(P)H-dependent nitroreductase NfsB [Erwiniaceae]HAU5564521.1 oxygen-insensitive NAD(P)H-dependent nitroreductase NfsB [Serratia fonticola]KJV47728.1 dihydropteridine reductase [Pantoea sp. BL1]MBK0090231.1 oxygen-insensitive NAD(P)H-dependent nitroreductase NfsB [Erwinia sp. S59]MBK0097155.1 oxygen-insensitive NAD(P)H-dependent nitroreductase NfsB [Erwinia sp. S63]MBK0125797.1 oxygen-insensitive NAD(P)H-dependent nitroreductase NfsB [Pantoea sp. S61]
MTLNDAVARRHTVKAFASGKSLPQEEIETLLNVLRNSPSSVNSQPWHFVVASTPEGREQIAQSTTGAFVYNGPKVLNASHVIALCMRTDLDDAHLQNVLAQEEQDGRFAKPEGKAGQDKSRRGYVDMHRYEQRDIPQWMEKQVYLALGGLLLGAAMLGIDATPMEGFDQRALDQALGLREKGFTSVVLVSLGYRSDEDFNAALPKSRLPREEIFTFI